MSLILIGSLTSPFVRKVRIACHGRVPLELKPINYFEEPGNSELRAINPINKLPILLDGDQKIFDSRVIYNYLSKKFAWKPLSMDEENLLSGIDAANDTCVNLFLLKRGGLDTAGENWYLERQRERLPSIMNYLSPWIKTLDAKNPEHWNYPSMSLYSFLYWAKFRGIMNFDDRPECEAFLQAFKNKPGIAETDIPK